MALRTVKRSFAPVRRPGAAFVAVTASYVYFLLFAQFGFLHALDETLGAGHGWTRPILGAMALAGLAAGAAGAWFFSGPRSRAGLVGGFFLAALAAGITGIAIHPRAFLSAAVLTGAGVGLVTVVLAGRLRHEIGLPRLGRVLGLATGLAYAVCNLPGIFLRGPFLMAMIALAVAAVGLVASARLAPAGDGPRDRAPDFSGAGAGRWIAIFFLLVSFDSAVFTLIQRTPAWREAMWVSGGQLWLNALVHLAGGILGGRALDRFGLARTLAVAAAGLVLAALLLATGFASWPVAGLYVAAVSVYSTALIYYPARSGRSRLAAMLYGVAGWIGSGVGIGAVERATGLAIAWPIGVGLALACLLAMSWPRRRDAMNKN